MSPAAMRIVSQLRNEFYSRFAVAMDVPVTITQGNSYASNLARASWLDARQQLNYVCIYAHTAPDELVPDRPLILRLAVNQGAGIDMMPKRGTTSKKVNHCWRFELTLLPEELLDFLPWIIDLITTNDNRSITFVPEPPHPIDLQLSSLLSSRNACTRKASSKLCQQLILS